MISFFKIFYIALFISLICSCEKDGLPDEGFYTIPEEHLDWFPFEENDNLVFKDENGISLSYFGGKITQFFDAYENELRRNDNGKYYRQRYVRSYSSNINQSFNVSLKAPSNKNGTELSIGAGYYDLDKNQVIQPENPLGTTTAIKTQCELLATYNTGLKTYPNVLHGTIENHYDSTKTEVFYAKNKGFIQYIDKNGVISTLQE